MKLLLTCIISQQRISKIVVLPIEIVKSVSFSNKSLTYKHYSSAKSTDVTARNVLDDATMVHQDIILALIHWYIR